MVGGRPLRVLAYVRVSTTEQGDRGTSLETQREEIERFCAAQGFPAPEVFVEVESAGETKIERRLALARLMADVQRGDLVIVAKQDRWSRHTLHFLHSVEQIIARGARFFAIAERFDPSTAEGRFASTIMAAVAEQERARIMDRTLGGRRALRRKGAYVEGPVPFGYVLEGRQLVVAPEQADTVREAFRLCIEGRSVRQIAAELHERWPAAPATVHRALKSRLYLGEIATDTTATTWVRAHEPMVDRYTWERAQAELVRRTRSGRPHGAEARTATWLLRGMLRCGGCGTVVVAAYGKGNRGYYGCRRRAGRLLPGEEACVEPYGRQADTDAAAAALVLARAAALATELVRPARPAPEVKRPDFAAKRARLEAKQARAIDLATDGLLTRDALRVQLEAIERELGRLEVEERDAVPPPLPARAREEALRDVRAIGVAWQRMTVDERRAVVRLLSASIVLRGKGVAFVWKSVDELLRARCT